MGFCNASCSFTRFRIIDPIPSELWTQIPDKLRQFAFRDIDDLPEMQAYGWVCFEDMLDSEWRTAPPHKGAYLLFSLRLDTRRIPAAVIKKHLTLALKAEKEKMQEQGKKFISRERKKELKEQHIMENGKVLQSNFNKNYFAKIDIRIDKEIKFYSKSARILTMHPSGSYTLTPDVNKQYVLRITNPQLFWSTSKYLVVLVK